MATHLGKKVHYREGAGFKPKQKQKPVAAFPTGPPANGKQADPSAYRPSCLHIFQAFSDCFLKAQGFIKLNEKSET
jgi:hypothetical protein